LLSKAFLKAKMNSEKFVLTNGGGIESTEDEIYTKRSKIIDSLSELIKGQATEQEIMTMEWEIVWKNLMSGTG
jgi:hypothetical protein